MAETPTIGELYKAKTVSEESIVGAVDVILAGDMRKDYPIADGYMLDLDTAVILARPVKA